MKIIKSYSELSELNRRDLFKKRGNDLILKPMNKKRAISIARQLATGFENIDLRQNPSPSEYRRAQKIIKTYYENVKDKNAIVIRPNKKNRAIYAKQADISSKFKVYPIHVSNKDNKIKIVKKNGKRKLKEIGEFINYENFYYESPSSLALEPEIETRKLLKDIDKVKGIKQVNIIVGNYKTNANYDIDIIEEEIKRFSMIYSNFENFTRGLQVATFKNQKGKKNEKGKRSKSKSRKAKNRKPK